MGFLAKIPGETNACTSGMRLESPPPRHAVSELRRTRETRDTGRHRVKMPLATSIISSHFSTPKFGKSRSYQTTNIMVSLLLLLRFIDIHGSLLTSRDTEGVPFEKAASRMRDMGYTVITPVSVHPS